MQPDKVTCIRSMSKPNWHALGSSPARWSKSRTNSDANIYMELMKRSCSRQRGVFVSFLERLNPGSCPEEDTPIAHRLTWKLLESSAERCSTVCVPRRHAHRETWKTRTSTWATSFEFSMGCSKSCAKIRSAGNFRASLSNCRLRDAWGDTKFSGFKFAQDPYAE